jgi:hypothetical protein
MEGWIGSGPRPISLPALDHDLLQPQQGQRKGVVREAQQALHPLQQKVQLKGVLARAVRNSSHTSVTCGNVLWRTPVNVSPAATDQKVKGSSPFERTVFSQVVCHER